MHLNPWDLNEADTCRIYIEPPLKEAGWERTPHTIREQYQITNGRVQVNGGEAKRDLRTRKIADYVLYYSNKRIAVVEAKPYKAPSGTGLQQAKDYAVDLNVPFAYAANGRSIIEFDFLTGEQRERDTYPTPAELWRRFMEVKNIGNERITLAPRYALGNKPLRYYQESALAAVLEAVSNHQRRILLTMATGTGKTMVAFNICWSLWNQRWTRTGEPRRPRILFIADRRVLVDDPREKDFAPFGDARYKIEGGKVSHGREMYFALYQSLSGTEGQPPLYKKFDRDFFDLILIDECHRGSAKDDSNWREILNYFESAYQVGLTATPLRDDNRDTYAYFGNPVYTYSLKQGIDDGFLAPYQIHRVHTDLDRQGWVPPKGIIDEFGRDVEVREYTTQDFERVIRLRRRTDAIARHLTDFMYVHGDEGAKTIVFCVNQAHAMEMQQALAALNSAKLKADPNYIARITSDEGVTGQELLRQFMDIEKKSPVIVTTSKLLTTGVDIPTCRYIVIARVINSMTEFKQIIGRGTRLREDKGKLYFWIVDYTGSATRLFADPEFDGDPELISEEDIDETGKGQPHTEGSDEEPGGDPPPIGGPEQLPSRYHLKADDEPDVTVVAEATFSTNEGSPRLIQLIDHTGRSVRQLYDSIEELRKVWTTVTGRQQIVTTFAEDNINMDELALALHQPDADPFDLLCKVAFDAPVRTRRERANRVRIEETAFFQTYTARAQEVLNALLDQYADYGPSQFENNQVLNTPRLTLYGNVSEIVNEFQGVTPLRQALEKLQRLLYAA